MNHDVQLGIIIPTRNRPDLIHVGIDSIRRQIGDLPLRVIVSDNSDAEEADANAALVRSVQANFFAYVKPPSILPMREHWEWALNYGLENTKCTHFTILTDRGLYRKGALAELIDVVTNNRADVASFLCDTILDDSRPIVIGGSCWAGAVSAISATQLLVAASECRFHPALPKFLNSVVPGAMLNALRQESGYIFPATISPDYGFAFELLIRLDRVLFIDKPLTVGFGLDRSNGAAFASGRLGHPTARDFIMRGDKIEYSTPVPEILTAANAIVHEFVQVRKRWPNADIPSLEMGSYLSYMRESIRTVKNTSLRDDYLKLLRDAGVVDRPIESGRRLLRSIRSRLTPKRIATFASVDEAVRYAYDNYP